ncbi:sarcosine oxidase subunit gamma family protein, partial [Bosea sp. (in: a-proteobacteria)]|uniref:sarcosine oxidase subunit gamma n=1 Tax=Bosea sp. (in: a-proteobacteria) TaxID=1871050 RepID=UPI00120247B6
RFGASRGGDALARRVEQSLGLALPTAPRIVSSAGHDVIWSGPDQWLLRARSRGEMPSLIAELARYAAVSDQSDARAALRLSGPHLRDALAKGAMIDLHPAAFAVGDAAATSVAHLGVQLWRLPDAAEGSAFEIMVARSLAGSFWSWFAASAAEFGCRVVAGRG